MQRVPGVAVMSDTVPEVMCGPLPLFDLGADAFEGGAHAVAVGAAAGPAEQCPVEPQANGVSELERLGDVGDVPGGCEFVAPHVQRFVPATDAEGELLGGDARGDGAG